MTTSNVRTLGLTALAVAGLTDILDSLLAITVGDAGDRPPVGVLITLIVTGLVSFAGYLGRGGLIAAYAARAVATFLGIPAFIFAAPVWVMVLVVIGIVLSVAGIWLTLPALRRSVTVRS
jgi:hypothetical protein